MRCASAGHLPAILLPAGRARRELFMAGRSAPLGVAGGPRPRAAGSRSRPATGFLLYTDGLVERRGESIDDGLDAAARRARPPRPARAPAALARALPEALLDAEAVRDDVCLLAFRLIG